MVTRTRVAVVITRFTAGAGEVALNGAAALDPRSHEVTVFYGAGGRMVQRAAAAGIRTVKLEHLAAEISPAEDVRGVRELSRLLAGRFDVVHTHSAKAGAVGRLAARRVGIPAVHTMHGFPFHDFQSRARRAVYVDLERRLGRITDVFLAIGSTVAADAIRLGLVEPERVRVVPSSVDTTIPMATPESRAAARGLLGLPAEGTVVGTVGRVDYQKAPEHFVEAARLVRAPGVRFVWVGSGTSLPAVRAQVARHGLQDRVLFVGERPDVPRLLPAFDLFAMSSRYEGIPCALVEAMLAGIPAVATAVNGVPEVVLPGQTGLLARAGDPASLARVIDHALARPEQAREWALAARALVADRWAPAELAPVLEQAYADAIGRRSTDQGKRTPVASSESLQSPAASLAS
ncbi:MAG TPA: glycosyltransferase [Nocardioidaceae bacterium]|nr:glycosyltransferase [Nocardioidaceae bacterium]